MRQVRGSRGRRCAGADIAIFAMAGRVADGGRQPEYSGRRATDCRRGKGHCGSHDGIYRIERKPRPNAGEHQQRPLSHAAGPGYGVSPRVSWICPLSRLGPRRYRYLTEPDLRGLPPALDHLPALRTTERADTARSSMATPGFGRCNRNWPDQSGTGTSVR